MHHGVIVRDIIHSDYPFTVEEDAAAWILLGRSAEDALATAANMKAELAANEEEAGSEGWSSSPRVYPVGEFKALVSLVADIHCGGALLTADTRKMLLKEWTTRVPPAEAVSRLDELVHLGKSWVEKREALGRLLTNGEA